MNIELSSLPNDVSSLKKIIAEQQRAHQKVQEQVNYLEEMVRLLKAELFGRKSEVRRTPDADQLQLFTQPEVPAPEPVEDVAIEAHTRKKRGRKPLPDDLPRVEVLHDYRKMKSTVPAELI